MTDEPLEIIQMNPSYEAFGMTLDFLSRSLPFGKFELAHISELIRDQLRLSHHLAALNSGREMVGYAGWIHTSAPAAEIWMRDMGPLRSVQSGSHDAAALTVVSVADTRATLRLMRGARNLNPGIRVFFKRTYDETLRAAKKSSVLNFDDQPGIAD